MQLNYFTYNQLLLLCAAIVIFMASVVLFHAGKKSTALVSLILGTGVLGYFIITLDPFLNLWDERIHALVAKNMGNHFFKPTLYENPLLDYDYQNWVHNHIWVHKQPLYLWQMAISIKIFGNNIIGVRMPSVIMHAIIPYFIYRMGKITSNDAVGFYGGLFFAVAMFPLELCSGFYSTDHNDMAFLFYITASFWAWFEFQASPKKRWIILIGLFSGCAILVKWLVGLLIYAIWGITGLIDLKKAKWNFIVLLPMVYALLVTVIVVLPWQLYIRAAFPIETAHEMQYNTRHFFEPIEGHDGAWWYHFDVLKEIYGSGFLMPFVLVISLIALLILVKQIKYRIAIAGSITIVYAFYSLAATKMVSFGIIVCPFVFMGYAALIYQATRYRNLIPNKAMQVVVLSVMVLSPCYAIFDLNKIKHHHSDISPAVKWQRQMHQKEMQLVHYLVKNENRYPSKQKVLFNASGYVNSHIPVMFYTGFVAYDFVPTTQQIKQVRSKGYTTFIVDNGNLPVEVTDAEMIVIKPE